MVANLKELAKQTCEYLLEIEKFEKEMENIKAKNKELKAKLKLFDEFKENENLVKKLKLLEKENEFLKSKSLVCDVSCLM